jgi:hypothetical protein
MISRDLALTKALSRIGELEAVLMEQRLLHHNRESDWMKLYILLGRQKHREAMKKTTPITVLNGIAKFKKRLGLDGEILR